MHDIVFWFGLMIREIDVTRLYGSCTTCGSYSEHTVHFVLFTLEWVKYT